AGGGRAGDATTKRSGDLRGGARRADVRRAAAVVLGGLGGRAAAVARALCDRLDDPEGAVRLDAIRAVSKLRADAALPRLVERVKGGGVEAEQAAQAAARLGARGTRALQELMPRVAPGVRRYIAAALAAAGTASAEAAALSVLVDGEPGVIQTAVRTRTAHIPPLTAARKSRLARPPAGAAGGPRGAPVAGLRVGGRAPAGGAQRPAGRGRALGPHPAAAPAGGAGRRTAGAGPLDRRAGQGPAGRPVHLRRRPRL